MTTPFSVAASAYNTASRLITQQIGSELSTSATSGAAQGPDFASFLQQSIGGVVDAGHRSDALTVDMLNGKANVVDVVTAVSQTEIAIESMVAVRDRVISAYEEIMRMPI
jgi:flagellar hook-basal body complex protein FliE